MIAGHQETRIRPIAASVRASNNRTQPESDGNDVTTVSDAIPMFRLVVPEPNR